MSARLGILIAAVVAAAAIGGYGVARVVLPPGARSSDEIPRGPEVHDAVLIRAHKPPPPPRPRERPAPPAPRPTAVPVVATSTPVATATPAPVVTAAPAPRPTPRPAPPAPTPAPRPPVSFDDSG